MGKSVKDRVRKHRETKARAGLMRVEVLVPTEAVGELRTFAAKLRRRHDAKVLAEVRALLRIAKDKYSARYLDYINVDPERSGFGDARVIAETLMDHGNNQAFKLGRQISDLVGPRK